MRQLKQQITNLLKDVCPRVYFSEAPDTAQFPYIVYDLSQGVENAGQIICTLDVDIWDKNTSSANVDALSRAIRRLDKTVYIDDDIQFSLFFDRILNTKSEDKTLKRNTAIHNIRYIERS